MSRNPITPIEGSNLVRTGQVLAPVEPTHLVKYKGLPKIGNSQIPTTKQSKYKLEPPLLPRESKPSITTGQLQDTYNSFEEHQIYVSPELEDVYIKEGIWDDIEKYNDLLDERAANLVGYDKLMTQAELDSNYSKIMALRNTIISSSGALDARLQPLDTAQDTSRAEPTDSTDDDDATVDFNKINSEIDTADLEGVGTERASVVDPAEVSLFLNSDQEARRQQQLFDNFSRVAPGNGLGSLTSNLLRQTNAKTDAKQFSHTLANAPKYNPTLGREYQSPHVVESQTALELKNRRNQAQPYMINTIQNNFGKIPWEEEGYRANRLMSSHFTPERVSSANWRAWDNPYSIEHPELELDRYKFRPTHIPELRNDGYSFGLHTKPSTQGNILYSNSQNGYNFTPLMRDDSFGSKATVKSSIDVSSHRIISSRM
jgi:hypothetical protein